MKNPNQPQKAEKQECPIDHSNSLHLTLRHQSDGISYGYCTHCGWADVKALLSQARAEEREKVVKKVLEVLDIEIEAWMEVHQQQQRTFQTKDFLAHMKNVLTDAIQAVKEEK